MLQTVNEKHIKLVDQFLSNFSNNNEIEFFVENVNSIIWEIYHDIPEKKRISYGKYSVIKELGYVVYPKLIKQGIDVFKLTTKIISNKGYDYLIRGFALQLLTLYGIDNSKDLEIIQKYILDCATDDDWILRECTAGFTDKLIKKYPKEMKSWFLNVIKLKDENARRFVCESLRPVRENKWYQKNPEYPLSILKKLFKEKSAYPRTSIGNNLSDWVRINPEMVYKIVEELVANGDKNSYWIAYRACRNLVKKEPIRVMDLLKVDEYKYKTRVHKRSDY